MPRDYFKSEAGIKAWADLGMTYNQGREEMYDQWFENFEKLTRHTKEKDIKRYIQSMKRLVLKSGEEFLVYGESLTKQDPLGNPKSFYRGNIGKHGIPIPRKEIKVNPEEGYSKSVVITGIDSVTDAYHIPFTKENIDPLIKYTDGDTAYSIQKEDYRSGMKISIDNFISWRDGNSIELLRFGHQASSYELQVLEDEKIGKFIDHVTPTAGRVYS